MTTTLAPSAATRSVERALGLLAWVCDEGASSLSDCARSLALSPSTALRLLRTLEGGGFVRRDEEGMFHAGGRIIGIGAAALGRQELLKAAEPALRRIVALSGESSYLSIRGPGETSLYVGMVEGTHSIRHAGWVGRSLPLDGTAVGAALRGEVPKSGYVFVRSLVEADVAAVAAPIYWPGGIAGALNVVGPRYRIGAGQAKELGEVVSREAQALTDQLSIHSSDAGWR